MGIELLKVKKMDEIGLIFGVLDNVWPDLILYSRKENKLWFIEAVTSDGEVDNAKMKGFEKICNDSDMDF